MKSSPATKPVRVMTGTVDLFTCPLCKQHVSAAVEVETRLGDLSLTGNGDAAVGNMTVDVQVPVRTSMRRLTVEHNCTGPDVGSEG